MALLFSLRLLILLIKLYQLVISPLLGPHCRFNPTCSQYGVRVLCQFGLIKGSWLMIKRILKCHPLHTSNYDAVLHEQNNRNREY